MPLVHLGLDSSSTLMFRRGGNSNRMDSVLVWFGLV